MLYREFGWMGWNVSAVGLGTWNIGNQWGEMSDATAEAIIHRALELGVNLFDTAESYGIPNGLSEQRLGRALRGRRDDVRIVTKIGYWGTRTGQGVPKTTPDMIRLCGHACLGRLRTDRVDAVLCHEGDIQDPAVYIEGFERLKAEGALLQYGLSTNNLETLRRFNDVCGGDCAVVEVDYSLINRAPEREFLPYCADHAIGVLARGPAGMGLLSGRYDERTVFADTVRERWNEGKSERETYLGRLASLRRLQQAMGRADLVADGLRYVISHPCAPVAIPGATREEQAETNAAAGAAVLDADTYRRLRALS